MGQVLGFAPVDVPRRPKRILCLCGNASNTTITGMQVGHLNLEGYGLELTFMVGPFPSAEAYDPAIQAALPGESWHVWHEPGSTEYNRKSLQTGVAEVRKMLVSDGPFGGLFGFSMGGLVSALVCEELEQEALAAASKMETSTSAPDAAQKKPRALQCSAMLNGSGRTPVPFLLAACATDLGAGEERRLSLGEAVPSLHILGAKDRILAKSKSLLASSGPSATSYEMSYAKHEVPMSCLGDTKLQETVKLFLDRVLE